MTPYYKEKLEQGRLFQDVVTEALYKQGIVLVGFSSHEYQLSHGENIMGAEIKNDAKFRETGNLYIETAEKQPAATAFFPSGIMRKDNSWLFIIGDSKTIWIFGTTFLREIKDDPDFKKVTKETSQGFLLPLEIADRIAIRKFNL